jgi:hypothetical protein
MPQAHMEYERTVPGSRMTPSAIKYGDRGIFKDEEAPVCESESNFSRNLQADTGKSVRSSIASAGARAAVPC